MKRNLFLLFIYCALQSQAQFTVDRNDQGLLISERGEKVLFYRTKPQSLDGKYERCNYIHPLWGVDCNILTEDFPGDHLHHRGIFWAWHQVWIDGQRIGDPWEIRDFAQEVIQSDFFIQKDGSGLLRTAVLWKSPLLKKDGKSESYIKENTEILIHSQKGNSRRIDFNINLLALKNNLTIGGSEDEKGYSGFSVRMKLPDDVLFTGKTGRIEPKNEAVISEGYINVSGSLAAGGGKAGICILDNPANPGYPQKWILRAKNSMQNAAWPGRTTVRVPTNKPLQLKYSLVIYAGDFKMSDK